MSKIIKILNILFKKKETKKDNFKIPSGTYTKRTIKALEIKEENLSVTEIAKHFKITPANLNQIFQKLNWSKREQRWIILTDSGKYNGAKQCYDTKNKVKYLRWNKSIKNNKQLIKEIEAFKKIEPKSNKIKGEDYEKFIAEHYRNQGYFVWEHGKEKGRLDQGIDLIVKKNKEIIFIQCKNWKENTRFKIDHVRVKASRTEARDFMLINPLFKGYKNKFRYTISNDCMHPSAIKYIEETKGLLDYEIIEMKEN